MPLLQVFALTNQGLERARNEDCCFAQADADRALLVVADGMGGHQAGNVASALAVSVAEELWTEIKLSNHLPPVETRSHITKMLNKANRLILDEAGSEATRRGMGTTLTLGLLCGNELTIGHIGDSRAYLIADDQIKMLTRDHSLLEHLIESGEVEPEDARNHPKRHVLTRALGISANLQVDSTALELKADSSLLFCTDGLTNMVSDNEILTVFREDSDLSAIAAKLVDLANSRGGFDNITVVIATGIGGRNDR